MSSAGAIGVDLGGQTAVVAIAKKGGVEIVLNEANYRETQVVVGFGETERFLGEQGYVQLKSNFKNTIVFPTRFLGLTPDSALVNEEKKWLYCPLVTTADNKLAFEVRYKGEKRQFLPEQVVAMMLSKLQNTNRKNGITNNDMVISVPSHYTDQERKALLDAAKISGINVLRLMNESSAIALSYGIFRKAEFDSNPRNVCFVDVGHTSTSVFVASFTKEKLQIVAQTHERVLGTRDFDWGVLEFCAKTFKEQNDINIMSNGKARLRLLDVIEKQRKVLSANSEASINVEYLAEDLDLNLHLSREKFEEIIVPYLNKFRSTLEKLKADLKVPLHSVEIVGGGTRIPAVQKIIQEVFGMEISRTLHATEVTARGCAIQAAMLSPLFKVADYGIEEANYYPIRCSWLFLNKDEMNMNVENDSKNNPSKQSSILFPAGASIPSVKAITFHKDDPLINFKLSYDPVPEGIDPLIAQYVVQSIKPKEPEFGVKIRVQLNKNGIIEFDSAQMLEDYYEEVIAPKDEKVGEKKEGEVQPEGQKEENKDQEVKKKKKTKATNLTTDISTFHSLSASQIQAFATEENTMNHADRLTLETYEKKNQLESYIYEMRNKLNESYSSYVHSNVKATFLAELEKAEQWLYGEGAKTTKEAYAKKIDDLLFFGGPIDRRYKEYQTVPEACSHFLQTLTTFESLATSNDEKYSHISSEERKPLLEAIGHNRKWIAEISGKLSNSNRAEEPPVKTGEINDTHNNFINEYSKIMNKPKPKPQEPPKQNMDTEKKTDAPTEDAPKKEMDIEKEK